LDDRVLALGGRLVSWGGDGAIRFWDDREDGKGGPPASAGEHDV
jgi:hypothetical protein